MLNYLYSIILGATQGLTEFLPISSSGHLLIFHDILNFDLADNLVFDVALHLGTLVTLLIFFWSDLGKYIRGWFRSFTKFDWQNDLEQRLSWLIVFGTVPAGLVGFFLEEQIKSIFYSLPWVAVMLIVGGLLFFIVEKFSQQKNDLVKITGGQVLLIGVAQAIALIPGVSRSGITIIAGLGIKLKRAVAARFSFLLSIPIVLGAGVKKIAVLFIKGINFNELGLLIVGWLTAAIVGYFALKYLLRFLEKHTLIPFAIYRIVLGGVILFLLFIF